MRVARVHFNIMICRTILRHQRLFWLLKRDNQRGLIRQSLRLTHGTPRLTYVPPLFSEITLFNLSA